jgi:hypothetical protein
MECSTPSSSLIYQATSPGIAMKSLDSQLREEKSAFRRSRIDFGLLPVALDATPLAKEYSYRNNESLLKLDRGKGEIRYFFFIQDRLWKIIDEINLEKKNPYGKTLQDAAVKLSTLYGAAGRVIPANPDKQIYSTTIDWKDATTHVRLIERGETAIAIAYEDSATLGQHRYASRQQARGRRRHPRGDSSAEARRAARSDAPGSTRKRQEEEVVCPKVPRQTRQTSQPRQTTKRRAHRVLAVFVLYSNDFVEAMSFRRSAMRLQECESRPTRQRASKVQRHVPQAR